MNKTQLILEAFKRGESLTQLEATPRFGTTRLAAVVASLKEKGYDFDAPLVAVADRFGNICHVARYTLKPGTGPADAVKKKAETAKPATPLVQGEIWNTSRFYRD